MNYVIMSCKGVHVDGIVTLNKNGNKFYLTYNDEHGNVVISRDFDAYDEAFAVFSEFAKIIGSGDYSPADRREMMRRA